jgi:hypothetical protein
LLEEPVLNKIFRRKKTEPISKETPSIPKLRKMATTKELKAVLKKIEDETIPTVRKAWIEYFIELINRPNNPSIKKD